MVTTAPRESKGTRFKFHGQEVQTKMTKKKKVKHLNSKFDLLIYIFNVVHFIISMSLI